MSKMYGSLIELEADIYIITVAKIVEKLVKI